MSSVQTKESKYEIMVGRIVRTQMLSDTEKLFEIDLPEGKSLGHEPGQFVQVSLFGIGEVPISVCSSPTKRETFEICVRKTGKVTNEIHKYDVGQDFGIRGPFGMGFPINLFKGENLLFVAGGLGIVPLRSLINYVNDRRRNFGKVDILFGCKTPQDMLFGDEINKWQKRIDFNFGCTVDKSDPDWKGNVGLITSLIPGVNIDISKTYVVVIGPPIMYRFVIRELVNKGIPDNHIFVSLERHMKCGLGKCGHCQIGDLYCCQEGPVVRYDKVKNILEGAI